MKIKRCRMCWNVLRKDEEHICEGRISAIGIATDALLRIVNADDLNCLSDAQWVAARALNVINKSQRGDKIDIGDL